MIRDEKEYPIPRLPNPLTEDGLRNLMRERPYWDLKHPSSPLYQRLVAQGFAFLFPGKTKYDGTGKAIDVSPLPPEAVAHQVTQVNREMDRLERDLRGSGGGAVHVQAHTRDGGKTEVADYWRAKPGEGGGDDTGSGRAEAEPANDGAEGGTGKESSHRLPAPDSREPVDPEEFYRNIGFDPNSETEREAALRRPLDAIRARVLRGEADDIVKEEYPGVIPHNNEANAFRHAYWSFEASRRFGPEAAQEFGDAHERSDPNPISERLMDLYNNKVGRDLAADPENAGRGGREVIREAIRDGRLRTRPFETAEPPAPLPDRPPGIIYGRSRNPRSQR